MLVWRICRERHAATAFSGEGARLAGGRWNSEGVPMAYASEHLSLAALELFVQVGTRDASGDLVAVQAEIPEPHGAAHWDAWKKQLPQEWRFQRELTRSLGDAWIRAKEPLAVRVPSVVIDVEWNVLINPAHPRAKAIKLVQQRPFRFDERRFMGKV